MLSAADEDQVRMMEERVILVDYEDNVIGDASKKDCTSPRAPPRTVGPRSFPVTSLARAPSCSGRALRSVARFLQRTS